MTVFVRCAGVSRRFGGLPVVDAVDLTVGSGEVVGLLGANGAGKTTLVRMVLGVLAPSGGEVQLFGDRPSPAARRRVGYVPQSLGLYEDLTAAENLEFVRAVFGRPAGGDGSALHDFPDVPVGRLPLGVQRRTAFAVALDHAPELLVLDEPTSGVGPLAAARLWDTVRATCDAGAGALVTTHNLEEAEQCDRLVVLAAGRVVAAGTTAEIVGTARSVVVRTGDWRAALRLLRGAGLAVSLRGEELRVPGVPPGTVAAALGTSDASLSAAPATLEERFVALVSGS